MTIDSGNLSQADKHLLYGLLLKKKRNPAEDRKLVMIMRSSRNLDEKIEAILALGEESGKKDSRRARTGGRPGTAGTGRKAGKKVSALVVDVHPELTKLLKKSSLKRRLIFTRIGESFDAIHLLRRLETRMIILNENLADDEYRRYFEICRAVQPRIKIIYLSALPRSLRRDPVLSGSTRFIPKPISIGRIEESVQELMSPGY
jgi:hypothetical protein